MILIKLKTFASQVKFKAQNQLIFQTRTPTGGWTKAEQHETRISIVPMASDSCSAHDNSNYHEEEEEDINF